jgi:predicted short-subunit dehydrogenase-like oxidoreductase (DUF2520 family)
VPEPIAIAGAGRIGQALGRLLRERGESIAAVASRSPDRAARAAAFVGGAARAVTYSEIPQHAARVLIAVPDDAICNVARVLAAAGMHRGLALHSSGAHGPEALAPLAEAGVACGTLHPLQTVANPEEGVRVLPGVAFAIDGAPDAAAWARRLAALLNGLALHVPAASRPLYHAAAVMASNYVTALMSAAVMLMKEAGVDEGAARLALEPLARTSVENALHLGPAAALTGPIARGDADTVRGHLAALGKASPVVESLYRAAGLATLEIARQRGLPEVQAGAIRDLLRKGERRD